MRLVVCNVCGKRVVTGCVCVRVCVCVCVCVSVCVCGLSLYGRQPKEEGLECEESWLGGECRGTLAVECRCGPQT